MPWLSLSSREQRHLAEQVLEIADALLERVDDRRAAIAQRPGEALQILQVLVGRGDGAFQRSRIARASDITDGSWTSPSLSCVFELLVADDVVEVLRDVGELQPSPVGRFDQPRDALHVVGAEHRVEPVGQLGDLFAGLAERDDRLPQVALQRGQHVHRVGGVHALDRRVRRAPARRRRATAPGTNSMIASPTSDDWMRPTSFVLISLPSSMLSVIRAPSSVSSIAVDAADRQAAAPHRRVRRDAGRLVDQHLHLVRAVERQRREVAVPHDQHAEDDRIVANTTTPTRNCLVRSFILELVNGQRSAVSQKD